MHKQEDVRIQDETRRELPKGLREVEEVEQKKRTRENVRRKNQNRPEKFDKKKNTDKSIKIEISSRKENSPV
jgi:hypothetical protein